MTSYAFASDLTERQRSQFSERLLKLREKLLGLTKDKYDHNSFCGTACCALGWAAADKRLFPSLRLAPRMGIGGGMYLAATDGGFADEPEEAARFFGEDSYPEIFSTYAYRTDAREVTAKVVAKRIALFVKQRYGYEPVKP